MRDDKWQDPNIVDIHYTTNHESQTAAGKNWETPYGEPVRMGCVAPSGAAPISSNPTKTTSTKGQRVRFNTSD